MLFLLGSFWRSEVKEFVRMIQPPFQKMLSYAGDWW